MHKTAQIDKGARLHMLVAALSEHESAKVVRNPEDNPFANASLTDITGAHELPALNMAAKAPDSPAAYSMESAGFEAREAGRLDKSAKRMAQARARAERKVEFDRIASSRIQPSQERMDRAWVVVFHMVGIVTLAAKAKQRWANRLLGSNADDIPQMALEQMALVLAKQEKWDLDLLKRAAEELGDQSRRSGKVPGDQLSDDERRDRKEVFKARKWLMGMVNNRIMGAVVDSYTSQRNLRWDNLDVIATVMASINGPGEDPMMDNFKASRAPAFLGTRFQRPDGIDANVLAMVITAAITDRGLDPLVEFILDDEHRRVDGAVKWSKHAKDIFMLTPGGTGEHLWQMVEQATAHHGHQRKARGDAARAHVRNLFGWLPSLVTSAVDAFDPHFVMWSSANMGKALMASDFESYLPEAPPCRRMLEPALRYGSVEEAAQALTEHLALLTTGEELVMSAVNA